jgi:Rrf2 family transcriptional regulator, iron-sulfur cluster assembly transcription factor
MACDLKERDAMISKTSLHAVQAFAALATLADGQYAGAGALAKQIGARPNYLGKLLQMLAREDLVISQKGFGGGFRLNRPPEQITMYDVVEIIDHVSRWKRCLLGRPECGGDNPCAVHDRWAAVREAYLKLLNETTIAELAEQPEFLAAQSALLGFIPVMPA